MCAQSRSLLQIHAAVLLFGLTGLFGKLLPFSPAAIVFGRVVVASLFLAPVAALRGLPLMPRPRRRLLTYAAVGALLAAHSVAFFQSVKVSSVAIGLISFSAFPAFVAVLEPLLSRQRPKAGDLALTGVALAGIAWLLPSFGPSGRLSLGVVWGISSGLAFALLSLLNRRCVRQDSGITVALYQNVFAGIVLLPFVLSNWPVLGAKDVGLLVVLGVPCTAVAHVLFIAGLRATLARTASMIACLEPLYGTALAALLLREVPCGRTAVGGLIVIAVAACATASAGADGDGSKGLTSDSPSAAAQRPAE